GLVCDIGGNSMELAEVSGGKVGRRVTSPLGPFRLQQVQGGKKGVHDFIEKTMEELAAEIGTHHERIYLVGGSWRAIARLDMERRGYPMTVLHEYRMGPQSVLQTVNWIGKSNLDELRARTGTSLARMELVPLASLVLRQLVLTFQPKEIDVSSYGIREGLLYEQMPERLRSRDPLIEACRHAERTMARMPGFGKKLYNFLLPLYRNASDEKLRLVRAACLLHDTTWRAHPDYRAEVCFDNATRANLGGLSHAERVFLGLALLHRYKNSREGSRMEPLFALLTDHQISEAEVLGKAMRFGAMFSIKSPEDAGSLDWRPKKKILQLTLKPGAEALFGEVAQARFASLAQSLGAEAKVVMAKG
ncbi:MAG: exopolyphosphatase, partial [Albidovulum sp.]